MIGRALIVQGDALHLPLPDESVDLCVTSPPYWALRSYSAGPGEIGSEPTPQAFLEALWAATAEMMRVLKPTGSMFVDLGDKYAGAGRGNNMGEALTNPLATRERRYEQLSRRQHAGKEDFPAKSLMLLPERYRIGAVDRLGLIARAVIVWDKPNGLPESVTDRVRRSHEDWVHLVKQPRYYSATDEIREPQTAVPGGGPSKARQNGWDGFAPRDSRFHNPLGKLPGSVWSIASEPLRLPDHLGVQHYAAFPSEWPRRLILGFSPPGICVACGQGRVPVVERRNVQSPRHGYPGTSIVGNRDGGPAERRWDGLPRYDVQATILGYACSCTPHTNHPGSGEPTKFYRGTATEGKHRVPSGIGAGDPQQAPKVGPWREYHLSGWTPPPTRSAIILDPFSGVGTTVGVAKRLGRIGIGVDLSGPYCRAARWRVNDPDQFGKAESRSWNERQGSLI